MGRVKKSTVLIGPSNTAQNLTIVQRARSGCMTCRKRHLKCDESRPTCSRCTKAGLSCDYGLRLIWGADTDCAGKCHGRAGIWSKDNSVRKPFTPNTKPRRLDDTTQSQYIGEGYEKERQECYTVSPQGFINTTTKDVQIWYMHTQNRRWGRHIVPREVVAETRSNSRQSPDFGTTTQGASAALDIEDGHDAQQRSTSQRSAATDKMLLEYYERVVCVDVTHIRRDDENDPRLHILSRALSSSAISVGAMMIAANFLGLSDPQNSILAIEYRQLVLKVMKESLESMTADPEDVMLLAMMLCSAEISDRCRPTWIAHLAVFRDIIQQQLGLSKTEYRYDYTYRLCCRYFANHLVIAKTAFPVEEVLSPRSLALPSDPTLTQFQKESYSFSNTSEHSWSSTENLALVMCEETLDTIDPYSGLSNSLLLLINEISDFKREAYLISQNCDVTTKDKCSVALAAKVARLNISLSNLQQYVSPITAALDPNVAENLRRIAETYRLAAFLLLHESSIPLSWPSNHGGKPDPNSTYQTTRQIFGPEYKKLYTREILSTVGEMLSFTTRLTVSWPLWPLFIAGCCANDDQDRLVVIELFKTAMQKSNIGNIRPAFKVIKSVWQQCDLAADEEVCERTLCRRRQRGMDQDIQEQKADLYGGWYEWGKVMATMGHWVSLA